MNPLFLNYLIANNIREIRIYKIYEDSLGPVVTYETNRQVHTLVKLDKAIESDNKRIIQLTNGADVYIILPGEVFTNKPEIKNHPLKLLGTIDITKTDYYRGWRR